jgi:hypothetical protein
MGFQEGRVAMFSDCSPLRIPMFPKLTPLFSICSLCSLIVDENSWGVEEKAIVWPSTLKPLSGVLRKLWEHREQGEQGDIWAFSSENGMGTKAEQKLEKGRVNP